MYSNAFNSHFLLQLLSFSAAEFVPRRSYYETLIFCHCPTRQKKKKGLISKTHRYPDKLPHQQDSRTSFPSGTAKSNSFPALFLLSFAFSILPRGRLDCFYSFEIVEFRLCISDDAPPFPTAAASRCLSGASRHDAEAAACNGGRGLALHPRENRGLPQVVPGISSPSLR